MIKYITTVLVVSYLLASNAWAQITPDIDLKPSELSGFSLNFEPPRAFANLNLDFSKPEGLQGLSLNFKPVMEMVALLEGKGAQVESRVFQVKEANFVELTVDGKVLAPILVECEECVIVFEY